MNKVSLALVAVLLAGCDEGKPVVRYGEICGNDTAERRAQFVLDCAAAANPLSDEEGEDLVAQCQATADAMLCKRGWYVYQWGQRVPCDEATLVELVQACTAEGWTP